MKPVYNLVKKAVSEDGKYSVEVYKNGISSNEYLKKWVSEQEAKLLTLDGTFGGVNGKKYDYLSTDLSAQDNWHIGKKYDMQRWFRYPMVIDENNDGKINVHYAEVDGEHNSYLVVSKHEMRERSKNLKRAKTEELKTISNSIVEKFIETFNLIANENVYTIYFYRDEEVYRLSAVYGSIINMEYNNDNANEILSNIPFNDVEFNGLLKDVLLTEAV